MEGGWQGAIDPPLRQTLRIVQSSTGAARSAAIDCCCQFFQFGFRSMNDREGRAHKLRAPQCLEKKSDFIVIVIKET